MQDKPKSNSVLTHEVLVSGLIVFKVKGAGPPDESGKATDAELRFNPVDKASAENRRRAELHGWIQRISDAAAISRDPKTGRAAEPSAKLDAMTKLVTHYESGTAEWRMAGSGATPQADVVLLIQALAEIYPAQTQDAIKLWVSKRSRDERSALMGSEKIKPVIDRLRSAQGAGVDTDALLSGLTAVDAATE